MAHLSIRGTDGQTFLEACVTASVVHESFPIFLPEHVAEPTDNLWKEIRWYLEDYARLDPFSFARALAAERALKSYGQSLASAISEPDVMHKELKDSSLLISIEYKDEFTPRMARVYWELLEIVEIWPEQRRPSSVSIVRRTKPVIGRHTLRSDWSVKGRSSGNNVLAITARPDQAHDIPHRLVTRSILEIVQEHSVGGQCAASFQVVRPGTFDALRSTLLNHDIGHFDILHLDMHGFVREGQAFLKFVPSNDDLSGEDDIPVLDVARLLAKRGVRYAIMNACQSASEEGPVSSAARTMINEGLLVAIGMRYQVLDSAVDIFVKNFYHHYMQKGEAFIGAAHIGRHALQLQPNRRTKFNTDVQVTDYVTPIVAVSTELDICHLCLNHTDSTLAHVLGKRVDIWGREGDILSLETKTAISTVLLIRASAGTGKTFLARHLCWWWKATGFVEDSVVIDCATVGGLGVQHIREKIDIGFGISSKHGSIDTETYLKRHKCLIVLDSLDAAQVDRESSSSQRALRSFLRRIKNCENSIVLLLSRYEERWVQTIANVIYHLNNLDMKASLQLATQEATASSPNNRLSDRLDSRFLEQCMSLVDGNALAISILMKEYHTTCDSFRSLYHKLTNGSVLNGYGQDDCEEDCQRGVIDARSIIRLHIGDSQAGFMRDDDFRLLAPFWYSFPANLAYYRMFYQLAKARVTYDNQIPELPNSWLKALIEGFSAREFDVAAEGKEFPASKISSLRSLEPTFRLCEEKGFLYRSNDSSLRIHPLMTLVLRSQPFALPEWAAHVIKVAFLRFVSYQKRHWPTGNNFVQDPKIRKTLDATFANYATACNFSLAIKPDFLMNCITFDIITFSIHHTERRALIVLDVCDRFLEVFGLPLARNGQSTAQNTFSGMGSNDIFADVRGKLEMCCLGAILCADTAAEMLDVQHNHLDLLEGIAENLRRHSELYDVNLEILAAARIRLARHTVGDQYIESDLERILKVADAVDAESGRILRAEAGLVGYDLAERVAKIEAPDEIDALEQELLRLLERQLDGIDAAESKVVIYEMLAVLDLKREKYEDASRHIDTAMEIFRPFRHNQPKRWQLLVDEREKMMAAKVFLAMLQVITSFNVTHTPPKDTES